MSTSPREESVQLIPEFCFPPLTPRQRLRVMLGNIVNCCSRANDAVAREGPIDDQYVAKQLHIAYGKLLDAVVLDLDPTADIDCSQDSVRAAEERFLKHASFFFPDDHQATGERRGA